MMLQRVMELEHRAGHDRVLQGDHVPTPGRALNDFQKMAPQLDGLHVRPVELATHRLLRLVRRYWQMSAQGRYAESTLSYQMGTVREHRG